MSLSFEELDTQSAEALPAREVMSSIGSAYSGPSSNEYIGGIADGLNVQDSLNIDLSLNLANIANGVVDAGNTVAVG